MIMGRRCLVLKNEQKLILVSGRRGSSRCDRDRHSRKSSSDRDGGGDCHNGVSDNGSGLVRVQLA